MNENITYIKQYIKTFNDRRLREEYNLYTSIEKPTILENYFKDFIKQEIDTRGIGVWKKKRHYYDLEFMMAIGNIPIMPL